MGKAKKKSELPGGVVTDKLIAWAAPLVATWALSKMSKAMQKRRAEAPAEAAGVAGTSPSAPRGTRVKAGRV